MLYNSRMVGLRGMRSCQLLILMSALFETICFAMARLVSLAVALGATSLAIGAASPIAAQSSQQQSAPSPRIINVPGQGYVYLMPVPADDTRSVERVVNVPGYGDVRVVPVRPRDTRSPRQRCVAEERAREGGFPSALAMRAIDLKCSQR